MYRRFFWLLAIIIAITLMYQSPLKRRYILVRKSQFVPGVRLEEI